MSSFYDLPPEQQQKILHEMVVNDINFSIQVCCLASAMMPILVIWILFSTPKRRRQPVFWIQMTAIVMSMVAATLEVSAYYIDVIYQSKRMTLYNQLLASKEVFKWLIPPLTDAALIFPLMAFYPPQLASLRKRALVAAFPIAIKVPRLAVICVNLYYAIQDWLGPRVGWPQGLKFQCVEGILQVLDNTFVSVLILVRIYRKFHAKSMYARTRSALSKRASRLLFEAFFMSFAPAVLLQIAFALSMIIPLARDELTKYSNLQSYLFTANIYISLTFSCLATSWSSLANTNAAIRITATSHRKLRYDETRSTGLSADAFAASSSRPPQSRMRLGSFTTLSRNDDSDFETYQARDDIKDHSESQSSGSTGSHKIHKISPMTSLKSRWRAFVRTLQSPCKDSADGVQTENDGSASVEAGRTTLLNRHGIAPPYKGADCTLLYRLMDDEDFEKHAGGFYFDKDNQPAESSSKEAQSTLP